jgi:hypothetical protein
MGIALSQPQASTQILTEDEVRLWLEWAGSKLLAMHITSPYPREPSAAWPAYVQEAIVAYGYSNIRLRPPQPTKLEIDLMDEILYLPSLAQDVTTLRILQVRSLVTPVSNRYLYSWTKIAHLLHSDKRNIQRKYRNGLGEIVIRTSRSKAYTLRHSFALCRT